MAGTVAKGEATAEIAVVGAGVIGLSVARALQSKGRSVVIVDPEPPGSQCSFGNAGHIAIDHVRPLARLDVLARIPRMLFDRLGPLTVRPAHLPRLVPWGLGFARAALPRRVEAGTRALAELLAASTAAWRRAVAAAGAEDLLRTLGALIVHESEQGFARMAAERAIQRAHGVTVEELDGAAARRMAPGLSPHIVRGTYFPEASHVLDPHALCLRLAEAVTREGGSLTRASVRGILVENGRAVGIATDEGEIRAGTIVVAAGVASLDLLRPHGFKARIVAERGYHLMVRGSNLGFEIPVGSAERSFVMTPMPIGLRLAGTVELAGRDAAPDWDRATVLARHAAALVPGLDVTETSRWIGSRPTLPDYLPAIGLDSRVTGFAYAFGHQHIGLTTAAVTGEMVAALIAGEPLPVDPSPFTLDRFGRR